ncbi:hypothetical protein SAMN05443377_12419 [Propionibacterium cyclohexanicum]|uniref:Uncharacterized protein n=1 Tax=Propionibacterium cyclohexanicum TaxID=64702 RepID=A0A1H9TK45_9ACTN|nr:hypothetical protein SAMN05443377_12419 [Propionibacterium cyclohexanicum]
MPFRVLSPASASGCRIITWKQPVDLAYGAWVSVYVKEPGSLVARATDVGWWVTGTDDPIAAGAWSLSWDGNHAHLAVWNQNNSTQRGTAACVGDIWCVGPEHLYRLIARTLPAPVQSVRFNC